MSKVAIVGRPNVGKTSLFNLLTGKKYKTGNWEGVTVEISNAQMLFNPAITVFDLPGIRGVGSEGALDHKVGHDFLLKGNLDLIVNIVKVESLEQDLKLSLELYEVGIPMVIVLLDHNDRLDKSWKLKFFDCEVLVLKLGEKGIIRDIINVIKKHCAEHKTNKISTQPRKLSSPHEDLVEGMMSGFQMKSKKDSLEKAIDRVVMNRWLAFPIFIAIISFILFMTILGNELFKPFFETLVDQTIIFPIKYLLEILRTPKFIINLFEYGVGSGLKTIAGFIPLLMILYLALGFVEESGYMARVSDTIGEIASKLGLSSKSMIPLIIGFGCNVPAIMGARIIENERQRILTIILIPFMSCSARLTVFALFSAAFFPSHATLLVSCLYFFSIFLAVIVTWTIKGCFSDSQKKISKFSVIPHYRLPNILHITKGALLKIKHFIVETGKIITVMSLVLYTLSVVPTDIFKMKFKSLELYEQVNDKSILVEFSKRCSFFFEPIGVDKENWPAAVSLLTGVLAKEVVGLTLVTLYDLKDKSDGGGPALVQKYFHNETNAFAYLLFVLIYFPCISVFSVMQKETSSKVAIYSGIFYTVFAYLVASAFHKISFYLNNSIPLSMLALIVIISGLATLTRFILVVKEKTKIT